MAAKSSPKALAKFTVSKSGDAYAIHVEDDGGGVLELTATDEQLDVISEAIDNLLSEDDAADAADGDDDDEEEEEDDDDAED